MKNYDRPILFDFKLPIQTERLSSYTDHAWRWKSSL